MTIFKKEPLEIIIIGLILHAIGGLFVYSSKLLTYTFCGVGLFLIFFSFFFLIYKYKKPFKGITRTLFLFYCAWIVFMFVRSFVERSEVSDFSPVDPYQWLAYLIPFILFLGIQNLRLKIVFKYSYYSSLIGLLILIFYSNQIFINAGNLGAEYQTYIHLIDAPYSFLYVSSFLLLNFKFVPAKFKVIGFVSLILLLFTLIYAARRGASFSVLLVLLSLTYLYLTNTSKKHLFGRLILFAAFLFIIYSFYVESLNSTLALFASRLNQDTRGPIEAFFLNNFKNDPVSWIIGRGISGTYFCPIFQEPNRDIIETGYLQLILKGGLINCLLYVYFISSSVYLGLFRSKNILSKSMACYLGVELLNLYPFGLPAFKFEYLIMWICIGYCHSKNWRLKTNEDISSMLNNNNSYENTLAYQHSI